MNLNQQLDAVFFFIKRQTDLEAEVNDKYIWNLFVERFPRLGINLSLFQDILRKLIEDGYVYKSEDQTYHLSLNGRAFKGYSYSSYWIRSAGAKNITQGIIYSLIVALITWAISEMYHSQQHKNDKSNKNTNDSVNVYSPIHDSSVKR